MKVDAVLKPCPFCGAEPRAWAWNGGARIDCEAWKNKDPNVHYVGIGARTMEECIEKWNNRVGDSK